jgi:predicted metal-dependent enzyme (double-stranded beta helix superfamily)
VSLPADPGLTLQLFIWPAGVWTPIHDHTSWGVYLCLEGELTEDRYARLDDGARQGRAHLRHAWREKWHRGQHSTLLPYAGGIHRVGNLTRHRAISLHLYGPPQAAIDGRDYDSVRDFVSDRPIESLPLLTAA